MSSSTVDTTAAAKNTQDSTCVPCDIPAFCRNNYYRGKLLTERDFTDEQRYGMHKLRLHTRQLHGWGVVCGLRVKPHPYCPDKRLVVDEGFAIDECGREIRLLADDFVPLPKIATAKPHADDRDQHGDGQQDAEGPRRDDDCGGPVPVDLYLCIRYAECETEFAPAPFDDCSCTTTSLKPNRVCEGYRFELLQQKPDFWDRARHGDCDARDCREFYRDAGECCAGPDANCCLPLAVIRNFVPGQPVVEEQIDNWQARRQLASTQTLDQVIRCILSKLPTEELTRIEDTNWEHNRRMSCREFLEEYIGTHERPRGFRIEFSHTVRSEAIDARSFQAMVVFVPENGSEPRTLQIAPAHIEREHDETTWARLHIDPGYARRHLDGRDFDLFLTLKCDVIRDSHGFAVDGNFLGRLPTGDHIQGGLFESWVRIRMRPKND
jgi:hypothetical protein